MRVQDEEFKTMIYDLMNGHYDLDKFDCEESSVVGELNLKKADTVKKSTVKCLQLMEGYARDCMSSPVRTGTWKS